MVASRLEIYLTFIQNCKLTHFPLMFTLYLFGTKNNWKLLGMDPVQRIHPSFLIYDSCFFKLFNGIYSSLYPHVLGSALFGALERCPNYCAVSLLLVFVPWFDLCININVKELLPTRILSCLRINIQVIFDFARYLKRLAGWYTSQAIVVVS